LLLGSKKFDAAKSFLALTLARVRLGTLSLSTAAAAAAVAIFRVCLCVCSADRFLRPPPPPPRGILEFSLVGRNKANLAGRRIKAVSNKKANQAVVG
jgi:hypothetical protein